MANFKIVDNKNYITEATCLRHIRILEQTDVHPDVLLKC